MDKLAIFGVPRSGTSWLGQIFNSHPNVTMRNQPLFSYEHKGRLNETSSQKEIYSFFEEIYNSRDDFALMASEAQKNYPIFCIYFILQYLNMIFWFVNQILDNQ